MSIGLWPAFDPPLDDLERRLDGHGLVRAAELCDELAETLGVTPLFAFCDMREVPEDFEGDADDLEELLGPWEEWFDAAEGRETVASLIPVFTLPEVIAEVHDKDLIIADLTELLRCLEAAVKAGARFRLELV